MSSFLSGLGVYLGEKWNIWLRGLPKDLEERIYKNRIKRITGSLPGILGALRTDRRSLREQSCYLMEEKDSFEPLVTYLIYLDLKPEYYPIYLQHSNHKTLTLGQHNYLLQKGIKYALPEAFKIILGICGAQNTSYTQRLIREGIDEGNFENIQILLEYFPPVTDIWEFYLRELYTLEIYRYKDLESLQKAYRWLFSKERSLSVYCYNYNAPLAIRTYYEEDLLISPSNSRYERAVDTLNKALYEGLTDLFFWLRKKITNLNNKIKTKDPEIIQRIAQTDPKLQSLHLDSLIVHFQLPSVDLLFFVLNRRPESSFLGKFLEIIFRDTKWNYPLEEIIETYGKNLTFTEWRRLMMNYAADSWVIEYFDGRILPLLKLHPGPLGRWPQIKKVIALLGNRPTRTGAEVIRRLLEEIDLPSSDVVPFLKPYLESSHFPRIVLGVFHSKKGSRMDLKEALGVALKSAVEKGDSEMANLLYETYKAPLDYLTPLAARRGRSQGVKIEKDPEALLRIGGLDPWVW